MTREDFLLAVQAAGPDGITTYDLVKQTSSDADFGPNAFRIHMFAEEERKRGTITVTREPGGKERNWKPRLRLRAV